MRQPTDHTPIPHNRVSGPLGDSRFLRLDEVSCAMAVCTLRGDVVSVSPAARALLVQIGMTCAQLPCQLPEALWTAIEGVPCGETIEWHASDADERWLGITRHRVGDHGMLLLLRELTDAHKAMGRRLQQQRLEALGRVLAGVAHDLRAPLANIMFGASVLAERCGEIDPSAMREQLRHITDAAARQQATISGLLDFARVGPPVKVDMPLTETFSRVAALLRSTIREGGHELTTEVKTYAESAYGNRLAIEQILVNLIVNAVEAAQRPVRVKVTSRPSPDEAFVEIHVVDDGDGIPENARRRLFEPFFTTKERGTGLGLSSAREVAIEQGGNIVLLPETAGAHFVLTLPTGQTGLTEEFPIPKELR